MNIFLSIVVTFLCMPWPALIMMSPMMIAAPSFAIGKSSIITAMLFFIYPAFIFMILKLTGYTFYGTDPIWWALTFFSLGSLVSIVYGLPRKLYNVLNNIHNYGYFIKDNRIVYLDGIKIKHADPKTFTHFNNRGYYSKDVNHVYYNSRKLKQADAATFQPLANDTTNSYWHDNKHAYYKWKRIPAADGASFEYAGHYYTFDKEHVFFQDQLIQVADKKTFKSLSDFIGKDAQHVFVQGMRVLNIKDVASFDLVWINNQQFGRDQDQIYKVLYTPSKPLLAFPGADPESFEVLDQYYAKDKKQVYYYSYQTEKIHVLKDANPENFTLYFDHIRNTDSSDGERYYKSGILIQ